MKLMSRLGNPGAASNVRYGTGGTIGVPTGSIVRSRFWSVTVVPPNPANEPVPAARFALLAVNGAVSNCQLINVFVTVIEPAMLNVPDSGLAGRLTHINPPSAAVANRTLRVI